MSSLSVFANAVNLDGRLFSTIPGDPHTRGCSSGSSRDFKPGKGYMSAISCSGELELTIVSGESESRTGDGDFRSTDPLQATK